MMQFASRLGGASYLLCLEIVANVRTIDETFSSEALTEKHMAVKTFKEKLSSTALTAKQIGIEAFDEKLSSTVPTAKPIDSQGL